MARKGIKEEERERKNECLGMLGEGEREWGSGGVGN
jgi:hypothetical protein